MLTKHVIIEHIFKDSIMTELIKSSSTMTKIKSWIYAGANGIPLPKEMSLSEKFLMLKYMSALSRNIIGDDSGNNNYQTNTKLRSFATTHLNGLFMDAKNINPELKEMIKNLKLLSERLISEGMDELPQDTTSWTRLLTKIKTVYDLNSDVWNDNLKKETTLAAVGLSLMEAEIRDYAYISKNRSKYADRINEHQINTLYSLIEVIKTNEDFIEIHDFFKLVDNRDLIDINKLAEFIPKYSELADRYKYAEDKAKEDKLQGIEVYSFAEEDARIYGNEYRSLVNLFKEVIETGNINATDGYNNTLLHRACGENNIDLAKFVINAGINLDIENKDGLSAYQYIFNFSTPEVLKILLEKNATVFENKEFIARLEKAAIKNTGYNQILTDYFSDRETAQLIQDTFGV